MPIDIRPDHLKIVQDILKTHIPNHEVWAFGSRAKWTAKDTSDLDLCVKGNEPLTLELLAHLRDDFSESNLPYKVDVVDWRGVSDSFRKIIEQDRVELPKAKDSDWREVKLGDVCNINFTRRSKNWKFDKMLYIDISSVGEGMFIEQPKEISSDDAPSRAQRLLENGDTIVSTVRPNRRSMLFLRNAKPNMVASTGFVVLRAKPEKLDQRFLYFTVFDKAFTAYLESKAEGSAYPAVNPSVFDVAPINIPPLHEQKEIAEILSALDDKIEMNNKMNETLEATAQALFKSWFVDFDPVRAKMEGRKPECLSEDLAASFPDTLIDSPLGQIPHGWEVKSLDEIAHFLNGLALQKYPARDEENSIPVIKIAELNRGITTQTNKANLDVPNEYIINDGDVLFSWSGSLTAILWGHGKGALNQHLFKVTSKITPKWFYYHWLCEHMTFFRMIAASKATTMGHIKRQHLTEAKVILPPEDLFKKISPIIEPLLEHIVLNNTQMHNLLELQDRLLPKLISGELRVSDAASLKEAV